MAVNPSSKIDKSKFLDDAVIIALGSNLTGEFPSCHALLDAAVARFADVGLPILRRSGWWGSRAWPDPRQPDYLNGVALVETALGPGEVMARLLALEAAFGRRRGEANAARTLDLDLVAHGRRMMDEPGLTLPHPRAHERLFVMGPLARIAPGWTHPIIGESAEILAARATIGREARPEATPDHAAGHAACRPCGVAQSFRDH